MVYGTLDTFGKKIMGEIGERKKMKTNDQAQEDQKRPKDERNGFFKMLEKLIHLISIDLQKQGQI